MRNIARIFWTDVRRLRRNAIAIVVLFGVVVLPSFFGWFNVLSSWDPFSNVANLKVAVANSDEGYQGDLLPLKVNVGEQVMSQLRANADLDWVFTSEERALDGTRSGEYYAALVIPPSFSRDMMTFLTPGAERAEIDYFTNEKKNALSPKITDQAATEVSTTINATFTKTLNEVGLALISSLADQAGTEESRAALARLQSSAAGAATTLQSSAVTLDLFSSLIGSSKDLVSSTASLTDSAATAAQSTTGAIRNGVGAAQSLHDVLSSANASISQALGSTSHSYEALVDEVSALDAAFIEQSQSATAALTAASDRVGVQLSRYSELRDTLQSRLDDPTTDPLLVPALETVVRDLSSAIERQEALRARIDEAVAALSDTNAGMGDARNEIIALANEARAAVDGARASYDGSLRPKLDHLTETLAAVNSGFTQIGRDLSSARQSLSGGSSSLLASLTQAEETTATIAQDLRGASERFTKLAAALQKAAATGDLADLSQLIGAHPDLLASELASPVGLKRIPVFEVGEFGVQMAPFYTVLGLWVGALLLSVLLRTDVGDTIAPARGAFTKAQEYFGRFGLFAALALLQSSLLYLGLMGFVGVQPAHPMLLLLAGWVMSFVFALITYTLVLSFGEAGKALAVFLLVVQISAGGGAYPLAVLPPWFQNISPWLPVTHATDAVRAALAGIYEGDYWVSLGQLALFLVPTLLIGLVLRLPVLRINHKLTHALESTKLM